MIKDAFLKDFISTKYNGVWPCGKCFQGSLSIGTETILLGEDFCSAKLTCSNSSCKNAHLIMGKMQYVLSRIDEPVGKRYPGDKYIRVYPKYFVPTLSMFHIHKEVSDILSENLKNSFDLFWSNQKASANCLRIGLECLMDELNVPAMNNLHNRIQNFQTVNPELGNLLMAIKWVGNAGSHVGPLTKSDLLETYNILEQFFNRFYPDTKFEQAKQRASEINTNKGVN